MPATNKANANNMKNLRTRVVKNNRLPNANPTISNKKEVNGMRSRLGLNAYWTPGNSTSRLKNPNIRKQQRERNAMNRTHFPGLFDIENVYTLPVPAEFPNPRSIATNTPNANFLMLNHSKNMNPNMKAKKAANKAAANFIDMGIRQYNANKAAANKAAFRKAVANKLAASNAHFKKLAANRAAANRAAANRAAANRAAVVAELRRQEKEFSHYPGLGR